MTPPLAITTPSRPPHRAPLHFPPIFPLSPTPTPPRYLAGVNGHRHCFGHAADEPVSPRLHFVVSSLPLARAHMLMPSSFSFAQQIDVTVSLASRRRPIRSGRTSTPHREAPDLTVLTIVSASSRRASSSSPCSPAITGTPSPSKSRARRPPRRHFPVTRGELPHSFASAQSALAAWQRGRVPALRHADVTLASPRRSAPQSGSNPFKIKFN